MLRTTFAVAALVMLALSALTKVGLSDAPQYATQAVPCITPSSGLNERRGALCVVAPPAVHVEPLNPTR
jgi:hypothetical protein